MDKKYYEKVFSNSRMQKYFESHPGDEQMAIEHYHRNIELSASFYPVLSLFEVALRNSFNRELSKHFRTTDWYLRIPTTPGLASLNGNINNAKRHIANRNETVNADKVIAELTLGFWVRLLNAEYERILWKPLRRAFPAMKKSIRKRNNVSAPINTIRDFRNRVFHHEPIAWNLNRLEEIHGKIITVMGWLNEDLPKVAESLDKVPEKIALFRSGAS